MLTFICTFTDNYDGVDANNQPVAVTASGNCNAQGQCLGNGAVCANDDQCYSEFTLFSLSTVRYSGLMRRVLFL